MKVADIRMVGSLLRHVHGGLYKRDWSGRTVRGVRLTARDERDRDLLMLISSVAHIPIERGAQVAGEATKYYLDLAHDKEGDLGRIKF